MDILIIAVLIIAAVILFLVELCVKVGDIGISTTRLAQIGYAEINGKIVEVKSIDGFLNEKTPIIVSRITDGTIMVEKHKE